MNQQQNGGILTVNQKTLSTTDTGYVVGVDIGGTNLRLALADLNGMIVAKQSSSVAGFNSLDAVMRLVCDGVEQLLQEVSAPRHALKSIAAGAPGITDVSEGIVIATSYLLGWRDVPLRALLEDALNVPSAVDNDVNLAAIGENWAGAARDVQDFVFLAIGTGLGSGIVLNGRPFRGNNWAAGEIGYMRVPGTPDTPREPGKPGSLESMIGGNGIKVQWQNLWSAQNTPLARDLNATQIFDHALEGDPLAKALLQQSAHMLSLVIHNMFLVLNCPLFVLGGGVGSHPALCHATRIMLEQLNMRRPPQVVLSMLGPDAQLIGAVRFALDIAESLRIKVEAT
ncbi:ROK family protein [Acidobacterium sp. S8]|uniref:ROK family protein n=1 Tax=Acidobacterium sp. S8 TaxID=1641854 RepID=UPI00131B1D54|nr:ROK family protein [Acidobacterium sp. S8]